MTLYDPEKLIEGLSYFKSQYVLIAGIILLVFISFSEKSRKFSFLFFISVLFIAFYFQNKFPAGFPLLIKTKDSDFFYFIGILSAIFCSLLLEFSAFRKHSKKTELYILLLLSITGISFVSLSGNLLMLFLSLEIVSVASYCLTAYGFNSRSSEAALKYILYGSAASGILVFGMSFIYGITGTLEISEIKAIGYDSPLYRIAWVLVTSGFLFKIAAFPFHNWAPDVYEGTPPPLAAYFSIAPKAVTFYALILTAPLFPDTAVKILTGVSIISMTFGNLLALNQNNTKRLLAYSSIAHAGFLLMGIVTQNQTGAVNIMYYFCIYLLMNFSAFHLLQIITKWKNSEDIRDFSGLGKINPYLATSLLVTMISLTGLPPAAGFSAKLFMFTGVYDAYKTTGDTGLFMMLCAALLNTVISLFYYLKMPFYAFFRDNKEKSKLTLSNGEKGFILILNALLLLFFIKPDWVFLIIKLTQLNG